MATSGRFGDKRKAAGRRKGSLNKSTIKIAEAAAAMKLSAEQIAGITPLEVMMHAMRIQLEAGEWVMASSIAEKAAPYMHPKLAARVLDEAKDHQMTIRIVGGLPDDHS